jgi:hypothetical protein
VAVLLAAAGGGDRDGRGHRDSFLAGCLTLLPVSDATDWAAAAAGVVSLPISVWALRVSKRSARAAERSADAAVEANELIRAQMKPPVEWRVEPTCTGTPKRWRKHRDDEP